jgi:hypothetical protein
MAPFPPAFRFIFSSSSLHLFSGYFTDSKKMENPKLFGETANLG